MRFMCFWGGRLYNFWQQMCTQLCQWPSWSTSLCKSNVSIWQHYKNSNRCSVYRSSVQPMHTYRRVAVTGTKRYSTQLICENGFKHVTITTPCTAQDELAVHGQGCASWHCEKRAKVHCTEQSQQCCLGETGSTETSSDLGSVQLCGKAHCANHNSQNFALPFQESSMTTK